jgi:hypothetical protein
MEKRTDVECSSSGAVEVGLAQKPANSMAIWSADKASASLKNERRGCRAEFITTLLRVCGTTAEEAAAENEAASIIRLTAGC